MRTSAIIGAAALCFSFTAGAAQAQNWRSQNPPPPPQREVWGVASWGQPAYRPYEGRDRNGRHEHETYRYGQGYGHGYGHGAYGHGHGSSGYSYRGYGVRQGYRDEWGYQDDRPHTARGYGRDSARHRGDHHDGCGCPDVYLYDR